MKLHMKYTCYFLGLIMLSFIVSSPSYAQTQPQNSVDMIWQSSGYTPPFYKGRALQPQQGKIMVVAVPHIMQGGTEIPAKNLSYKWQVDGTVWGEVSGMGQNKFEYDGSATAQAASIDVEISDTNDTVVARGSLGLHPEATEVMLYENDPLTGVLFQKALTGKEELKNSEVSISAFPFFFSVAKRRDQKLSYVWKMNAVGLYASKDPDITLRKEKGTTGTTALDLTIQNAKEFIQTAQSAFTLSI